MGMSDVLMFISLIEVLVKFPPFFLCLKFCFWLYGYFDATTLFLIYYLHKNLTVVVIEECVKCTKQSNLVGFMEVFKFLFTDLVLQVVGFNIVLGFPAKYSCVLC